MTSIQKKKTINIAFGTKQHRSLFPHKCAYDRTGNEIMPLVGSPNRGPGVYDNHVYESFIYQHDPKAKPCSNKGCYLNRSEKRFFKLKQDKTPAPNLYQEDNTKLKKYSSRNKLPVKPFGSSIPRFLETQIDPMLTPGPGSYPVHNLVRNRKVTWPQEFGGRNTSRLHIIKDFIIPIFEASGF